MSYRLKTSGDWWPLMVIATLSATPARRILRIAERRRSWIETPTVAQPVASAPAAHPSPGARSGGTGTGSPAGVPPTISPPAPGADPQGPSHALAVLAGLNQFRQIHSFVLSYFAFMFYVFSPSLEDSLKNSLLHAVNDRPTADRAIALLDRLRLSDAPEEMARHV
jgi:hypothetical protein